MAHTRKLFLAAAVLAVLPSTAFAGGQVDELVIVSGAVHDPQNAQYAQAPADKNVPALPVVYEDKK
ncbi:MAG: hypothetical protein JOZ72_07080 [Alphaproteobacteria bacterium]|nr:hypothetical protein [Alphaproteobacteria bacterium]